MRFFLSFPFLARGRPVFRYLGVAAGRPPRPSLRQPRALQSTLDRQGPNSAIIILVGFMSGGASVWPGCTENCVLVRHLMSFKFTRAQDIPKYMMRWEGERMGELGKGWLKGGVVNY